MISKYGFGVPLNFTGILNSAYNSINWISLGRRDLIKREHINKLGVEVRATANLLAANLDEKGIRNVE